MNELLGKWVVAKTMQGERFAEGRVRVYCEAPTVTIETRNGESINWRVDLCEVIEDELTAYLVTVQDQLKSYGVVELDIRFRRLNEPWVRLNEPFRMVGR